MPKKEVFQNGIAAILATHNHLREPDSETSKLWAAMLKDIPNDIFIEACMTICKHTKSPQNVPGEILKISRELAGELTPEQAYLVLKDYYDRFYSPEFNSTTNQVIRDKVAKDHPQLLPFLQRWGMEIAGGGNPTATRAQFIRSYEGQVKLLADRKSKELKSGDFKKLEFPDVE